jgi:hypothetical protein
MAMDYTNYIQSIANLTALANPALPVADMPPEFQQIIPQMIDFAEKKIYRELDVIDTIWSSQSTLTRKSRVVIPPPARYGSYITFQNVSILIPSPPQRVQLQPVTIQYLNSVWGTEATLAVPLYFAPYRQDAFFVGPYPDKNYTFEVLGTYRPEPLSPSHPETFLTEYMPDIFLAASMIFISSYMRDFGAASDNPQQAQSWEAQYNNLVKGAMLESLRQKFAGPAWTSLSAIPIAPDR